jgi:hypothetical protein
VESKIGRVFNVNPNYISNPENNEFISIYRNKLDNKYYGRRSDGVDEPLGGVSVDCFNKKINGPFDTNDTPSTFGECFLNLESGDYIFDLDVTSKVTSLENPAGQIVAEIRINTTQEPNVDPGDQIIESRQSLINLGSTDDSYNLHLMSGKVQVSGSFTFKAAFWDGSENSDMNISNVMMRAIKIG